MTVKVTITDGPILPACNRIALGSLQSREVGGSNGGGVQGEGGGGESVTRRVNSLFRQLRDVLNGDNAGWFWFCDLCVIDICNIYNWIMQIVYKDY